MAFEQYIQKGTQRLRLGYTTGTCAALAAKAAATALITGAFPQMVSLVTPKGLSVDVPVLNVTAGPGWASCAVQKDAGDDPDITNGMLVFAKVCTSEAQEHSVDGGVGVGRVTKPGLNQPVGEAAINSGPRHMILTETAEICRTYGYKGYLSVVISIPEGEVLAKRTFNPKLGIVGGLSVLGTSGIVEPMSAQALIDCIGLELRTLAASGEHRVVLTPGNYGEAFLAAQPYLKHAPTVKFSNFVGDALDFAAGAGFREILLVGHIGKFVKLAGGIMNTHSAAADCRAELITAHGALVGASGETLRALMESVSTEAAIDILDGVGLREAVLSSLLVKIQETLERRGGPGILIGAVIYSQVHGKLGETTTAARLINALQQEE